MNAPCPAKPTLKNYRWISRLDETTDKMVSDWDNATECSHCGRAIVYVCEMTDGSRLGRDCAFKELGLTERTIEEHIAKQSKLAAGRAFWAKQARAAALPTIGEANRACRLRNNGYNGHTWIGRFETGFYAVPDNCSSQLQSADEIIDHPTITR